MPNYADYEYVIAAGQLILAMLGMGAALRLADFRAIARWPYGVILALALQYFVCPLLAIVFVQVWPLPAGIAVGLLLAAALPSGSLSNIYTYLGHGNLALSITATTASTLICLVVTPMILRVSASAYLPADFQMPTGKILMDITSCLLLPLAAGMVIGNRWPSIRQGLTNWCIRGSLLFLALLVIGSLTSGRIDVWAYGWTVPTMLVLLSATLVGPLQLAVRACGLNADDAFTTAIEVTMRNGNLGIFLKASIFPAVAGVMDPIGDAVLFVILFYGGGTLIVAALPILYRRTIGPSAGWVSVDQDASQPNITDAPGNQ